jgi:hypothetical protein
MKGATRVTPEPMHPAPRGVTWYIPLVFNAIPKTKVYHPRQTRKTKMGKLLIGHEGRVLLASAQLRLSLTHERLHILVAVEHEVLLHVCRRCGWCARLRASPATHCVQRRA